jgi:hypothetical protein
MSTLLLQSCDIPTRVHADVDLDVWHGALRTHRRTCLTVPDAAGAETSNACA